MAAPVPNYAHKATFIEGHDGDSFWLTVDLGINTHGIRFVMPMYVRLYGIDTWELSQPKGVAARGFTIAALAGAKQITVQTLRPSGRMADRSVRRSTAGGWPVFGLMTTSSRTCSGPLGSRRPNPSRRGSFMQGKVPVGVTSVAGYTVTLAAVVAAVLAFLKGDRSDQTLGVLAAGGMAVLAFLSTQLGRYAQAKAHIQTSVYTVPEAYEAYEPEDVSDEGGENAPPEASLYPLTDPTTIPHDLGDAESEGTA